MLRPSTRFARRLPLVLVLLAGGDVLRGETREAPALVRIFSSEARNLGQRLDFVRTELASLPDIPAGPRGGSLGYHSRTRNSAQPGDNPLSVTVDLGRERPVEAVVLVPATVMHGAGDGRGYGFPPRFRVELATDPEFEAAIVLAQRGGSAAAVPPPAVILEPPPGSAGRFVRVTATELWLMEGSQRAVFALSELMVFSRGRNVAPGKEVRATDSTEGEPLWSAANLVDGQSSLGHALAAERSASNGYHSAFESSPDHAKWVKVDLGSPVPVDEVRVFPARPIDWAESHGFGFPERFRIEAALDPDFTDPVLLLDCTAEPFPNPGDNPVIIPTDDLGARFVRFTATQLWRRENVFVFALAEMQVFSGGENVALGAPVTASDSTEAGYFTEESGFWSRRHLVDGFDSQQRLLDDELSWLRGVVRRHELEAEHARLESRLRAVVASVTARLGWLAGGSGLALAACTAFFVVRSRTLRRRETSRLRERIAADLHDEIGSNLGSIALMSELGGSDRRFAEINRVARDTADSMRDIAWVIRSGHDTLGDLVIRMQDVAAAMLAGIELTFETDPAVIPPRRVSLSFKRHVLLLMKEALHNLVRHARATKAAVRIATARGEFSIEIADNGRGFDPDAPESQTGAGLKSMAKRAETLGGRLRIESAPGKGTTVRFETRIP